VPDGVEPGVFAEGGLGVVGAGLAAPDPAAGAGELPLPVPVVCATAGPINRTVTPPSTYVKRLAFIGPSS
jgi:hypothetical protein